MKPETFTLLLLSGIILNACSPKIKSVLTTKRATLPYDSQVFVLSVDKTAPEGSVRVGEIAIGDTGFTIKCNYEVVIEEAKLKARESGANIVKLSEHKTPNVFGSSSHRIKATLFYTENTALLKQGPKEHVLADVDYALLYIYRYPGQGALVGYDLQLGDSTLCRVKNNFKQLIKIKEDGLNTLWAKTESKTDCPSMSYMERLSI